MSLALMAFNTGSFLSKRGIAVAVTVRNLCVRFCVLKEEPETARTKREMDSRRVQETLSRIQQGEHMLLASYNVTKE